MNLKDALKIAGTERGMRRKKAAFRWLYLFSDREDDTLEFFTQKPSKEENQLNTIISLGRDDVFAEDWIVEPLPEPEKQYIVFIFDSSATHRDYQSIGTKSEILAALKQWAGDDHRN